MAEYIETVLPSGRGVRIEALKTAEYLAAQKRAARQTGNGNDTEMALALSEELLKVSLRAYTNPLPIVDGKDGLPDIDAMLDAATKANAWQPVTYEELIVKDGPRCLTTLFSDPSDFFALTSVASGTLAPGQGRLAAVAGKKRVVSGAP